MVRWLANYFIKVVAERVQQACGSEIAIQNATKAEFTSAPLGVQAAVGERRSCDA